MIETMTSKLKSWASAHLSPLKIDFMSLNRLRLNQSVESIFETNIPYTEQARKGYMDLRAYLPDLSLTLDNPKVLLNPFGRAPLFALIVFHSETPCHVSYTVHGHQEENSFSRTLTEETTVHVVPVFGLYAGEANQITVSLLDETETETASREIIITTGSLPYDLYRDDALQYLAVKDHAGDIRYYLDLPASMDQTADLSDGFLAVVENVYMTPNYLSKAPTHFHVIDLYGFTYCTYYVGSGIDKLSYAPSEKVFYIQSHEHALREEDSILEMNAATGEVPKIFADFPVAPEGIPLFTLEEMADRLKGLTLDEFCERFNQAPDTYLTLGWLTGPRLHKGASSQTTDSITKDALYTDYGVRITLLGDTLSVTMHQQIIQEILLTKFDAIFQMDFSAYIDKETPEVTDAYTVAVPLSEIHSGTYSLILRFVNGEQAVLADAIMLSRRRS